MPADWTGYRNKATVLFYMDQPEPAFQALKKSFEMCPMTEKELQGVADAITRFVVLSTRDTALAERMIEFLMYGKAGKDGQESTADDVKDPSGEILSRVQYARAAEPKAEAAKTDKPVADAPAVKTDKVTPNPR